MKKNMTFMMIAFSLYACVNATQSEKQQISLSHLYELIETYKPADEINSYTLKKNYSIGDSLNNFYAKVNPNQVIEDTLWRKAILFFLEKKYLYLAKKDKKYDGKVFYIFNASCWIGNHNQYNRFALNVFSKIPCQTTYDYNTYSNYGKDLVCVDSIIKESCSYHIEKLQHKRIQDSCLLYLPNPCHDF